MTTGVTVVGQGDGSEPMVAMFHCERPDECRHHGVLVCAPRGVDPGLTACGAPNCGARGPQATETHTMTQSGRGPVRLPDLDANQPISGRIADREGRTGDSRLLPTAPRHC